MANFTGLAAARHVLLQRSGWDVEENGLFGAPTLPVVISKEAHVSVRKALALLGLGRGRVIEVPNDQQGRMRADALPPLDNRTLLCIQAGNVNTGAFDPAVEICARAHEVGAWVHVDGAFGLWAATAPARAHLVAGFADADSWATDGHKWLNVPYDSGFVFAREPQHIFDAMAARASYFQLEGDREPCHYTPELSRRARGIEIWAAFAAEYLRSEGYSVLNDVVLNQVLVSFGDAETTGRVIAAVQADGSCWCGGTEWQGQTAMRISVSSWATTQSDIEESLKAIVRIARGLGAIGQP